MNFTNNIPTNTFEVKGHNPERGDVTYELGDHRLNRIVKISCELYNLSESAKSARRNQANEVDIKVDASFMPVQAPEPVQVTNQVPVGSFDLEAIRNNIKGVSN